MSSQVSVVDMSVPAFLMTISAMISTISQEFEKDQSPGPHLIENYHSLSLNKGQVLMFFLLPFSSASFSLLSVLTPE